MKKKILSLFMVIAITIFNFMPTMVRAEDKPVASISRDSKIYLVDIKKDGVSDLKYIYSSDITNDNEIFNSLSQSISSDFATLIPTEFTEGNIGIMSSTKYSSEMNANWSDYDYVINNYYTGEITDRVSDLYYNVNNTFKNNTDTENAELEENFDFLEDNIYNTTEKAEVFFPIGQHQQYVYKMVGGQLEKTLTEVIDYERVTIYYRSANVTTSSTTQYGHNNIWTTSGGQVAVLYENRDTSEQADLDGNHYVDLGHVVDYVVGDSITVKAKANDGYKFVGWYVSDVQKGAEYYYRDQLVSTNANYTYQPGVTTISGIDGTINYLTAAFEEDTTPTQTTPTYEYIDNTANQTYTIGEDGATFRINADYSLFENGGKVYVDDTLVSSDNYTSKSGSTIITFTKDYMSSLSEGEHTLKVAFNNGGEATTKFTVAKANTTAEETTNNPQTGDNIMFYISMLGLSIIGLAGAGLYIRKRRIN